MSRKTESIKITAIGAIVDFVLAVFKIIVGYISNSAAMIADGIHSFSDLISDGITLFAAKHSTNKPDKEHPYGHGRFETMATFVLSIILAVVGLGVLFDAITGVGEASILKNQIGLIIVAIISIVSKETLYWATIFIANKHHSNMLRANAWHHRSDALSSIVVLIGIIGSVNGYYYLDSIAAGIVGVMIIYIAWELGFPATKELVDTAIDSEKLDELSTEIGKISGVVDIHLLRTRSNGSHASMDAHIQVEPFLSVSEGHIISVSVERVAKQCLPELSDVMVHIDPEDDEQSAPYANLPERGEALGIINKQLLRSDCNKYIEKIVLHYLAGKIHIDFYLPMVCLQQTSQNELLQHLIQTIDNKHIFGKMKLYFC